MSTEPEHDTIPPCPADWPGQQVVELDNLGDPGGWLEQWRPDIEEALHGEASEMEGAAVLLAEAYMDAASEMAFPLPSDFEASEAECREMVEAEFRGFLLEWRRRMPAAGEGKV